MSEVTIHHAPGEKERLESIDKVVAQANERRADLAEIRAKLAKLERQQPIPRWQVMTSGLAAATLLAASLAVAAGVAAVPLAVLSAGGGVFLAAISSPVVRQVKKWGSQHQLSRQRAAAERGSKDAEEVLEQESAAFIKEFGRAPIDRERYASMRIVFTDPDYSPDSGRSPKGSVIVFRGEDSELLSYKGKTVFDLGRKGDSDDLREVLKERLVPEGSARAVVCMRHITRLFEKGPGTVRVTPDVTAWIVDASNSDRPALNFPSPADIFTPTYGVGDPSGTPGVEASKVPAVVVDRSGLSSMAY